jgi:hypothetical protein
MTRLSRSGPALWQRSLCRLPGAMFAIALMVESGCLIPQSIDPEDSDAGPHPAPHFVREAIPDYMKATSQLELYRQGPGDLAQSVSTGVCHCQLQLAIPLVEEEDPTITLQVRWFLDYDLADAGTQSPLTAISLPGSFDNPATQRPMNPFFFDPDVVRGNVATGTHVIEAVVADQAGFDDSADAGFPFRTMKPGFGADVYTIVTHVDAEPDPLQQHCPGVAPSPPAERINCKE